MYQIMKNSINNTMGKVMNGDIVLHPNGKALAIIWPWNQSEVTLKPVNKSYDLGAGAGEEITIPVEEANKYQVHRPLPNNNH